jgi:hypothetical protein
MNTSITRDELYALVWSEPIQKLAKRFKISDRGLGKLCARHGIPAPPRGWWARKAAGKRVKQDPLPPLAKGQHDVIRIEGQKPNAPPQDGEQTPLPVETAFERDPANAIIVDTTGRLTLPLIRDAAAALRSAQPDRDGIVHSPRGCLDVRVSKASIRRALQIWQALVRGLEERGYKIEVKEGKTWITVLGEPFRVFLKERLRQTIRDLTPDEHRQRREGLSVNPYTLTPSGELSFQIGDSYTSRATSDGKKHRLDDSLNAFMEMLIRKAYQEKGRRVEREREEERRREAERKRKDEENRNRQEIAHRKRFDRLVELWLENENRKVFLIRLRAAIGEVPEASPLAEWLSWAEDYIEMADPLARFGDREALLKVYASGYASEVARMRTAGFRDPDPPTYQPEKAPPPGIRLQDVKPDQDWMTEACELELPEDLLLPFETTKPGYVPRTFYVPARVLNKHLFPHLRTASGATSSES